ncbi:hypothetical protein JCM10207_007454 [Rhodosporidiobolus poonsookiae]
MDSDQSHLGLTAPLSRQVETVVTRTETRTSHAPRRASHLPLTLEPDATPLPTDDYALLHIAPAVTTTVVTTTTETTTTFAPIRVPKTRTIRPAYSSFSGPSGADARRATAPLTPRSTFRQFLEADGASSSAIKLDPRLYPLSQAQWPGNMARFNMDLGGMKATFFENAEDVPPEVWVNEEGASRSGPAARDSKGKGKERATSEHDEEMDTISAAPHLSRSERGSLHQRRISRRGRGSIASGGTVEMEDADEVYDTHAVADLDRASPGPPRKRPRADSPPLGPRNSTDAHVDPLASAAAARAAATARRSSQGHILPFGSAPAAAAGAGATLPSPNQSPPSPVPTFGGEDSQELKDDDGEVQTGQINPQAFDFGSGAAFSSLLSLPDFINTFDQLPSTLQSYLVFQLLRRSSIPVLQTLNQVIEPSLRRDFLSDLPPELGFQVLCLLDAKTLCRASLVSKKWKGLIDGEWRVWKDKLVQDGLWIGDGSEEREARDIVRGPSEDLFLKRWQAGVWDRKRPSAWSGKVEPENLYTSGRSDTRRPSISHRLASPSSSRETSPFPPAHSVHPFKLLYRRRFLIRRNWRENTPKRTTFPLAPHTHPSAVNPNANHVVTCLQFDKDKVVWASDGHSVNVFDTSTGALRVSLNGHEGGVWALQYIGNVLVSGSTDRTVRIWDLETGRCTHTFIGHTSTVRCLQIVEPQNVNPDPNGAPIWEPPLPLIVTGSRDWSLRVWKLPMPGRDPEFHPLVPQSPTEDNTEPSENPYHIRHLSGHKHAVRALAAHGRTLVSGSYDMDVRVWDLMTGKCRHRLTGHTQKVYSVVYDPIRQQCASGSMDGTVRLWSTTTGECRAVLEGHSSLVGLLGLSHRSLVSAAADWTLRIWDPETGRFRYQLGGHQGAITCFQHDEHKVISGSDGTLKMWDVATGELVRDLLTNLTGVWQVAFDQRFCVAAVSRNNVSEFEILDFGAVEPDPPVRERYGKSPSIKREEDEDVFGYSSTLAGSSGAGAAAAADVTMADLSAQNETPLAGASSSSFTAPPAPRLQPAGFTGLPSASSSTTSLAAAGTPTGGANALPGPSHLGRSTTTASEDGSTSRSSSATRRIVRRTNESRDLQAQARAQAGNADASGSRSAMDVEGDEAGEDDELDVEEGVQVKTEEVEEFGEAL